MKKLFSGLYISLTLCLGAGVVIAQTWELVDTVNFKDRVNMRAHEMSFEDAAGNKFGVSEEKHLGKGAHLVWLQWGLNLSQGTAAAFKVNTPKGGTYKLKLSVWVTLGRNELIKCNGKEIGVIIGDELVPFDWSLDKSYNAIEEFEFKILDAGKAIIELKGISCEGNYFDKLEVYRLGGGK